MPSRTPRVDASATADKCRWCGRVHHPDAECPPTGRWLISGRPIDEPASTVIPILYAPPREEP